MFYILDDEGGEEDDTPKSEWKPPPVIPKEDNRTGTNKRTFFVTTERRYLRPRLHLRQNLDNCFDNQLIPVNDFFELRCQKMISLLISF